MVKGGWDSGRGDGEGERGHDKCGMMRGVEVKIRL